MTNTAVVGVLLYNLFIVGAMTFLFVHFENGWPALMIFLLAGGGGKNND
jgi:hypothetical protein